MKKVAFWILTGLAFVFDLALGLLVLALAWTA